MSIRRSTLCLAFSAGLCLNAAQAQTPTTQDSTASLILCSSDKAKLQIANSSFTHTDASGKIADWNNILHVNPQAYEFTQDAEDAYSPPYSARIRQLVPEVFGALVMEIPIPACLRGKTARLTAYLKTKEVDGTGAGLLLQMRVGGQILSNNHMDKKLIRGTTPWKPYSIDLKIHPATSTIQIGAMLQEGGTLWADDIRLEFLP